MNLLLLEPDEVSSDGVARLDGPRARHVREVLRADVGASIRVGIVDGAVGRATVEALAPLTLRCELGRVPERPAVDLILALPRPKVLKRLYAPIAALGVGWLALTNAEKVERYYFDSHAVGDGLARARMIEGLAQAKDTRLPRLDVSKSLKRVLEDLVPERFGDGRRLVADPVYRRSVHGVASRTRGRLLLALGPEGGWTPHERDLFERHGFLGVGLGPRVLRSDTAAIALLALAHEGLAAGG